MLRWLVKADGERVLEFLRPATMAELKLGITPDWQGVPEVREEAERSSGEEMPEKAAFMEEVKKHIEFNEDMIRLGGKLLHELSPPASEGSNSDPEPAKGSGDVLDGDEFLSILQAHADNFLMSPGESMDRSHATIVEWLRANFRAELSRPASEGSNRDSEAWRSKLNIPEPSMLDDLNGDIQRLRQGIEDRMKLLRSSDD